MSNCKAAYFINFGTAPYSKEILFTLYSVMFDKTMLL